MDATSAETGTMKMFPLHAFVTAAIVTLTASFAWAADEGKDGKKVAIQIPDKRYVSRHGGGVLQSDESRR